MRNYAFSNATSSRSLSVNAYHTMPRWHWSREHRRYLLPEARLDADMFLLCINRDMATSIRCFLDGSLVVSSIHWWFDAGLSAATKASLPAALYLTVMDRAVGLENRSDHEQWWQYFIDAVVDQCTKVIGTIAQLMAPGLESWRIRHTSGGLCTCAGAAAWRIGHASGRAHAQQRPERGRRCLF
jgi:hypothetical protein